MKKKLISLFLCVSVILGCTGIAYADVTEAVADSQIIGEDTAATVEEGLNEPEDAGKKAASAVPHWSGQISQMTQAGGFEEGTVVVCIDPAKARQAVSVSGSDIIAEGTDGCLIRLRKSWN